MANRPCNRRKLSIASSRYASHTAVSVRLARAGGGARGVGSGGRYGIEGREGVQIAIFILVFTPLSTSRPVSSLVAL